MLKARWVRDSRPAPSYISVKTDVMHITRAHFEPGMWQETEFPSAPGGYATMDTSHIQLLGRMVEASGQMPTREPGWISDLDTYPIPAGVHRRVAIDQVDLWCCRSIVDDVSVDHVDGTFLARHEERDLPQGTRIFLASGSIEVADQTIKAPHLVRLLTSGRLVTALEDSYAFVWQT